MSGRPSRERLLVLDLLRGVAALAVVIFHFTDSAWAMAGAGWVREAAVSVAGLAAVILSQMHREIHLWNRSGVNVGPGIYRAL